MNVYDLLDLPARVTAKYYRVNPVYPVKLFFMVNDYDLLALPLPPLAFGRCLLQRLQ